MIEEYILTNLYAMTYHNKYTKKYTLICERAKIRYGNLKRKDVVNAFGYVEAHHIIPKSICPELKTRPANIIFLTPKEHYICHLLLTKMFCSASARNKMVYAYKGFCGSSNDHQTKRYSSKLYNHLRSKLKIKNAYHRLYNLDKVKYIPKDDTTMFDKYVSMGWSSVMTPEYKVGRVGNMKGKTQSQHQKNTVRLLRLSDHKLVPLYKGIEKINIDIYSDEYKNKIDDGWTTKHSKEYRANITKNSHTGSIRSAETKEKIKIKALARHTNIEWKKTTAMKRRKSKNINYNVLGLNENNEWVYTDKSFPDPGITLMSAIIKAKEHKMLYVINDHTKKRVKIPSGYGIPPGHSLTNNVGDGL